MNKKKPTAQAMATVIWAQVKPEMGLVSIRVVAANRCGGGRCRIMVVPVWTRRGFAVSRLGVDHSTSLPVV